MEVKSREEQIRYTPTNTIPLEPGVIFMVKEAKQAVAAVRRAGVEVIEMPNEEFSRIGGALRCRTMRVLRDPGPLKKVYGLASVRPAHSQAPRGPHRNPPNSR